MPSTVASTTFPKAGFWCIAKACRVNQSTCEKNTRDWDINKGACRKEKCQSPRRICFYCLRDLYQEADAVVVDYATGLCSFHQANKHTTRRPSWAYARRPGNALNAQKKLGTVSIVDDMIRCDYYVEEGNRHYSKLIAMLVSRERYVELWRKKLLAWQRENIPRPKHLPDPEAVAALIKMMAA